MTFSFVWHCSLGTKMNDCILSSKRLCPSLTQKENSTTKQACHFSFISVCLRDLTRKRMLIQPLEKGILGLTQSRTCIVHSLGKILIIFQQASHVRYRSTREYGVDFFQRRRERCIVLRWHLLTCSLPRKVFANIRSWRAVTAASR